jgi:hypothetical protein
LQVKAGVGPTEARLSVVSEFATVDLVLNSGAETRAVDAFALALIKSERQARRLFTYLVYQYPWCDDGTVQKLRKALADRKDVYFKGIIAGWDALYPRTVAELVGAPHASLWPRLEEAGRHRNKIFHGQLTVGGLSRAELKNFVEDMRSWCELLAANATIEVGYDGFGRRSFRKASNEQLHQTYKEQIADIEAYKAFIERTMTRERPNNEMQRTSHGQDGASPLNSVLGVAVTVSSPSADLRKTLLALQSRDVALREELQAEGTLHGGYHPRMEEVHRDNARQLRELIARFGWPNERLAGSDGAEAAWLIAQHAIAEPDFMRFCCTLLEREVASGTVPKWQLAYLDDRVRVSEGRLQRFGTQFEITPDGPELCPVENPDSLDTRRLQVGLGPIADRLESMKNSPRPNAEEFEAYKRAKMAWRVKVGWAARGDA